MTNWDLLPVVIQSEIMGMGDCKETFELNFMFFDNGNEGDYIVETFKMWRNFEKDPLYYMNVSFRGKTFLFRSFELMMCVLKTEFKSCVYRNDLDYATYEYYQGDRSGLGEHTIHKSVLDEEEILNIVGEYAENMMEHNS